MTNDHAGDAAQPGSADRGTLAAHTSLLIWFGASGLAWSGLVASVYLFF